MINMIIEDCTRINDHIYFIARDFNVIFKMEICSGSITIVGSLPEEKMLTNRIGFKLVAYKDYLFFPPMNAQKLWRYDILRKEWKPYELKQISEYEKPYCLMLAVPYKNKIFFVGGNYPAIVVIDMVTEEMSYIEEPLKEKEDIKLVVKDGFFRTDYVLLENNLYLASCLKNEVLKLNLDTYDYEYYSVGNPDFRYSGIGYDGERFFLSPRRKQPAAIWDGGDNVEIIELYHKGGTDGMTTQGVLCKDDKVILAGWDVYESFVIEKKNGVYSSRLLGESFWFYKKIDDDTYVRLLKTGKMMIDIGGSQYQYELKFDNDQIAKWIGTEMKKRGEKLRGISNGSQIIREKHSMDLGLFVYSM